MVVQVALVLDDAEPSPEKLRDRFLGGRLSRAACYGDHARARLTSYGVRKLLQGKQRVVDLHDPGTVPACVGHSTIETGVKIWIDERASGSLLQRLRDERVPVEPGSLQRHEEIARLQRARIRRQIPDRPGRRTGDDSTADGRGEPSERDGHSTRRAHQITRARTRRAESASRATATSSNGRIPPAISWYFSCPLPAMRTTSRLPARSIA